MDRRHVIGLAALVTVGVGLVAFTALWSPQTTSPESAQAYPTGAGPDHINFSALAANDANVSHTPREHWDSYAIVFTAPPDRPLIEGDYYINSATGEILADRWHNATVYRNGTTYAAVQPAAGIPNERQREELESDDSYVYHNATDAYYRYDPHYGQIAPTNIGRHPALLMGTRGRPPTGRPTTASPSSRIASRASERPPPTTPHRFATARSRSESRTESSTRSTSRSTETDARTGTRTTFVPLRSRTTVGSTQPERSHPRTRPRVPHVNARTAPRDFAEFRPMTTSHGVTIRLNR
jgi:hypothetical protein